MLSVQVSLKQSIWVREGPDVERRDRPRWQLQYPLDAQLDRAHATSEHLSDGSDSAAGSAVPWGRNQPNDVATRHGQSTVSTDAVDNATESDCVDHSNSSTASSQTAWRRLLRPSHIDEVNELVQ